MALESDSRKLFVAGLADSVTEQSLREWFEAAGLKVSRVGIPFDRTTGRSRGFAFVTLDSDADAERARQELDGSRLEGRDVSVREFRAEAPKRGPGYGPPQASRPAFNRPPGAGPPAGSFGPRPGGPVAPSPMGTGGPRPMPARAPAPRPLGGGGPPRPAPRPGGGWGGESGGASRGYAAPPPPTRATWDEPRRGVAAGPRTKENEKKEKRKKGNKLTAERGHQRRTSEAFRWLGDEDEEVVEAAVESVLPTDAETEPK